MAVKALEEIYGKRFFARRYKLNWRVPIVCDAVKTVLNPSNMVDAGCAVGDFIHGFQKIGIDAAGIEGSKNSFDYLQCNHDSVYFSDLRKPLPKDIPYFDLVMCLEVAEHIEPEFARMFAENLTFLSDKILISAATPGQGGHYHVNCQPQSYWVDMFSKLDYRMNADTVDAFQKIWEPWRNKKEMGSYYKNLLYFETIK